MNILTDALPEAIQIDGEDYPIDTDFRNCLEITLAYEDKELTIQEKHAVMLDRLYQGGIPHNLRAAVEQGVNFLNGGDLVQGTGNETQGPRLYSFEKDAALIYAAFRQTHGIDLQKASLHWFEFLAMFMDIGSDTAFSNLIGLRKRVKTGKATKEERSAAREMGNMFTVEDQPRELDERIAEDHFFKLLNQ